MNDRGKDPSGLVKETSFLKQESKDPKPPAEANRQETACGEAAAKALRESEEHFRLAFEHANVGICLVDLQGKIFKVNSRMSQIFGYAREELESMTVNDIAHPDHRKVSPEFIGRAVSGQVDFTEFEKQYHHKDGRPVWGQVSSALIRDAAGQPLYFISHVIDITERRRVEASVREGEKKIKSIFLAAPVGIGLVSNRVIIEANDRLCEMTGYRREELLGKNARFLYPTDDDYEYVGTEKYRQIAGSGTGSVETRWRRKDGEIINIILSSTPLDEADLAAGVTFTALDITVRKRLESQLLHAQKMEAIGTLAGGIAHDFNNLLMGIQGYASLALMDLEPSHPNYERLKRIGEHVQSGADLTRQLLGYARGGRYEMKPTNISDLLKKTASMFGRTKKEIAIYQKDGADLWNAEVDRGQMEQVLMNLYVNAWQAMPEGGEIYLEAENVMMDETGAAACAVAPGPYVKISVTDTGTGMDAKTRERIFDPFFTTKTMGRGTGLGLATVYGIVMGHKGAIQVYSEPQHGTSFKIYLPASALETVEEKEIEDGIAKGTEAILLVDDERTILEVGREMLATLGYRVYVAGSGQEGIAVYREKRNEIDLVILDMIMTGMSGGKAFDYLREANPAVKVLLSSGYSIDGDAQEILNRGCNGFLQKPFHIEKLSRKIREILSTSRL